MSQALQSCLEPPKLEPCVLMHALVPPKQEQLENPCSELRKNQWNFIEALSKTSHSFKPTDNDPKQVYVHPLLKLSSSSMSMQSLEMCTESVMSETGSNSFLGMEEFSYHISEKKNSSMSNQPKSSLSKKVTSANIFPPPLTSITGSNGVQMEARREEGRLLIKAFALSSYRSSFEIERGNGRLTLSLPKNDDCDNSKDDDFNGSLRGEKVGCKITGGEWGKSRCNGDGTLPRLPFYVAIS